MTRTISAFTAASLIAMLALVACQTAPRDGGLLPEARDAVTRAASDPDVTRYSANELNRARQLLTNAEGAAQEKGATDQNTAHYAYLAMQTARIAEQRAREQVAMARIKAGESERQQILLTARESEAQRARNQAQNAQAEAAQAQAESQRLARQLEDLQASQTSRGIVLTLGDVLFDSGRAELKPGAARPIEQVAQFLNENPERRVQIEGFTDSQGAEDYNLELSQKRADAVAMAIIQRGIAAERVRALGYGESYPKASNDSAGSRQMNRRVEIIVSNGDESIPGRTASGTP
ncbi:MAG TPA: OmpA family protein [Steroidobacteraceae bacterium]|nr:OmpA family protein [Steroidobacteraceae bacterium]